MKLKEIVNYLMKWIVLIFLFLHLSSSAQEIRQMKIDDLETFISTVSKPTVINFWATWCRPCIEEMPYFNKIVNQSKNTDLVFVSLDKYTAYPEEIRSFIRSKKIDATLIWLNETDADVFCPRIDEDWQGSIPATLFINHEKNYRRFIESQISPAELRKQLRMMD
jgi:thiol-disulfide isomerase/thioredoxin